MSVISADFHSLEILSLLRQLLKIAHRLEAICSLHCFSNRAGMPSGPHAFEVPNPFNNLLPLRLILQFAKFSCQFLVVC